MHDYSSRVVWTTLFFAYYCLVQMMNGHAYMLDASVPFQVTDRTHDKSKQWNPPSRMLTPERRVSCPSARTISLVFARGRSNVIVMQYHPHFLRCSAANIMHVYIVNSLLGSMFTNGSGRTADVLYAEVLLCTLLTNPLQLGRGKIICKHIEGL